MRYIVSIVNMKTEPSKGPTIQKVLVFCLLTHNSSCVEQLSIWRFGILASVRYSTSTQYSTVRRYGILLKLRLFIPLPADQNGTISHSRLHQNSIQHTPALDFARISTEITVTENRSAQSAVTVTVRKTR
jgi:hypothetical protein